jgi:hypothetical protein
MTLPPLTKKQLEILILIYRFRFIDRQQIQTILHHKNHRRIHAWLNDLVTKNCIGRIYIKKIPDNAKPAVYFLGKYGRKHLHKYFSESDEEKHKEALIQLTKTYKDSQRTEVFRATCLALVDCYLAHQRYVEKKRFAKTTFLSLTECATYPLLKKFDSYLSVKRRNGTIKRYVFLYFTNRTPRRFIRYRVAEIIKFFKQEWDYESDQPYPSALGVCSNVPLKNYVKKIFESKLEYYNHPKININLATLQEITTQGMEKEIWIQPQNDDE